MTTKATPGPWAIWRERKTGERIILGGDHTALCDVHPCPERDANARLIAAAPELRDFIAQIARLLKDGEETPEHPSGYDMPSDDAVDTVAELVNSARALLARIEGEDH